MSDENILYNFLPKYNKTNKTKSIFAKTGVS